MIVAHFNSSNVTGKVNVCEKWTDEQTLNNPSVII